MKAVALDSHDLAEELTKIKAKLDETEVRSNAAIGELERQRAVANTRAVNLASDLAMRNDVLEQLGKHAATLANQLAEKEKTIAQLRAELDTLKRRDQTVIDAQMVDTQK